MTWSTTFSATTAMTRRLLRRGLVGTLMLMVGVVAFQFVNPFIADSIGGEAGLESLIESLPPGLQSLAQISPDFIALTGLAGYLSLGYDHPVYLVLVLSGIVGYAGRAIGGEVDRGTLALSLSRPIPRTNIYLARVIGLVVLALAFGAVGPLATWLGLLTAKPTGEVGGGQLVALGVLCALFAWAVGGLSLAVSAASSTTGRVVGWATGFLVVSFFVDYFSELWDTLEPLNPYSIFSYFDTTGTVVAGSVPGRSLLVLGLCGLVGIGFGWWTFLRRDFEV